MLLGRLFALFIVTLGLPSVSYAADKYPLENWDQDLIEVYNQGPHFLSEYFETNIAPPSANNSLETKAELDALVVLKAERSDDNISRVQVENKEKFVIALFNKENVFDFDAYPRTKTLVSAMNSDLEYFVLREKLKFARVRPSDLKSEIDPVIANPKHASYPSGHAAQSYMVGMTLADINPSMEETYINFAKEIGHRREIAGVHFASDTIAGKALAKTVYKKLMGHEEIQQLFVRAKQEFDNKNT